MGRRGRCETPPQTTLHSRAKSLSPGKTAFQRPASRVLRARVPWSVRLSARRVPEECGLGPRPPRAARFPEAPTGDALSALDPRGPPEANCGSAAGGRKTWPRIAGEAFAGSRFSVSFISRISLPNRLIS